MSEPVEVTGEFDPEFEGDELQPAFDSEAVRVFQRLAGHVRFNVERVTLTKADLELGGESIEVVTVVAMPETALPTDEGFALDVEPLAVIIDGALFDNLKPRGGFIPGV